MTCTATFDGPYGEKLSVQLGVSQNGQPKVQLWVDEEEGYCSPAGTLSIASPILVDLAPGEFLAKVWSENEEIAAVALKSGLFIDTGRRIPMGFVEAQVWLLKGRWEHCSPELLNSGVSCSDTIRRPCECPSSGSHDHFIFG